MQGTKTALLMVLKLEILAVFSGIVASVLVGARLSRSCHGMPLLKCLNVLIHTSYLLFERLIYGFQIGSLLFELGD